MCYITIIYLCIRFQQNKMKIYTEKILYNVYQVYVYTRIRVSRLKQPTTYYIYLYLPTRKDSKN